MLRKICNHTPRVHMPMRLTKKAALGSQRSDDTLPFREKTESFKLAAANLYVTALRT